MIPTMNKQLIVFDFDFTIAKTIEHILVESPRGSFNKDGKFYERVHPTELQQRGICDDEKIDEQNSFTEFYGLNLEKSKIINPILIYLKYYSDNQKVFILTARPQSLENDILKLLKQNKVNTDNVSYNGLANSSFLEKIKWIKNKISNQYDTIILFEDNKKLIDYLIEEREIKQKKELYYINNLVDKTVITYHETKT